MTERSKRIRRRKRTTGRNITKAMKLGLPESSDGIRVTEAILVGFVNSESKPIFFSRQ